MNPSRLLLLLASFAVLATAQGTRSGPGVGREQMWPAPTREDWQRPVLITFQRTWKDALAVSKETGRTILVCINMDGEIASEHYAGIRYREPEIAALYAPYVCVIASTYRHNPRDHDDEGNRILCPRFGSVTCGEHIWIEPILFKKFMDGQRVAPRHICVDLDGKEIYDVFYRNDTASVFTDIRDKRPAGRPTTVVRGDRPLVERVGSPDVKDRSVVEAAYRKGDAALRRRLLDAAAKQKEIGQLDLLRLAVFGLDVDAARKARAALAEARSTDATGLISDALRVPMDQKEREALIATLARLGKDSPLARWLAGAHQGLGGESKTLDLKGWTQPRGAQGGASQKRGVYSAADITSEIEAKARSSQERPTDPEAQLELAEATLALAMKAPRLYATNPRMARLVARHMYADARRLAAEAEALGAKGWRLDAVRALAAYYSGDRDEAYELSAKAVKEIPKGDGSWSSMAVVTIFAEGRWKTIKRAVKERRKWPTEYLTDLHAAYSLLLRHPLGTARQVLWHYDLLMWLRVRFRAWSVLREGIARFRDSPALHEKYRERIMKWRGPQALEQAYEEMLKEHKDPARLSNYAGYASNFAAEAHRRRREYPKAIDAYTRAIAHYENAISADPRNIAFARPAIALALAGRARVHYQLGDDESALRDMLGSFDNGPDSAGTRDGMGITPGETAQMLLARLKEKKGAEASVKRLQAALSVIHPDRLRPDVGLDGK